jgi:hypothetical protein
MRSFPASTSVLPAEWTAVLDGIEAALKDALADAEKRARSFLATTAEPESTFPGLEQLAERMRRLHAGFEEAARESGETDALLQQGQRALQCWQAAADALRQRLAKWQVPSI